MAKSDPQAVLTVLSRTYCHLCHDMKSALIPLAVELGVKVEVLDIDAAPELEVLYNELVPVLLHEGTELCHYFLDDAKVRDYLSKIG